MFSIYNRVTADEIAALTCEARRLLARGGAATDQERDALREWKLDVLNRIAADPGPFADDREAEEVRALARREAVALRHGLPSSWDRGELA